MALARILVTPLIVTVQLPIEVASMLPMSGPRVEASEAAPASWALNMREV